MNRNPNIIAIIPIIIAPNEKVPISYLILSPIYAAEIPKKSKHNPTIIEINSDENIGNMMNIKPMIIANIPAPLLTPIRTHLLKIKLILYMMK